MIALCAPVFLTMACAVLFSFWGRHPFVEVFLSFFSRGPSSDSFGSAPQVFLPSRWPPTYEDPGSASTRETLLAV